VVTRPSTKTESLSNGAQTFEGSKIARTRGPSNQFMPISAVSLLLGPRCTSALAPASLANVLTRSEGSAAPLTLSTSTWSSTLHQRNAHLRAGGAPEILLHLELHQRHISAVEQATAAPSPTTTPSRLSIESCCDTHLDQPFMALHVVWHMLARRHSHTFDIRHVTRSCSSSVLTTCRDKPEL
jgi:hypothetical protein